MRIAFLAPLPPPRTGQSLCDLAVLNHLQSRHEVTVIHTSKGELRQGAGSVAQIPTTIRHVHRISRAALAVRRGNFNVIYHSPSQTRVGNLKDLLLLTALGERRPKSVFHFHGGGFGPTLAGWPLTRGLNRLLFSQVGAAIVLSSGLANQLSGVVSATRIHSVANFADDDLFRPVDEVGSAQRADPLQIVFIGSLFRSKGWPAVVAAARYFHERRDLRFRFVVAGAAPTSLERADIERANSELPNLSYVGEVDGPARRALLHGAAAVAVPTTYPWEGQPLVILEAYAAGAVVLATEHAGIGDVFKPGINGWGLSSAGPDVLIRAIEAMTEDRERAATIAVGNRQQAEQYRRSNFVAQVEEILAGVAGEVLLPQ